MESDHALDSTDYAWHGVARYAEATRVNPGLFQNVAHGIGGPVWKGGLLLSLYRCGWHDVTRILASLGMSEFPNAIRTSTQDDAVALQRPSDPTLVVGFAHGDSEFGGLSILWFTDQESQSTLGCLAPSLVSALLDR